jgi:glyoxylase-like metal-dependent hydrolase (beta-lactamase superfamily II)
MPGVKVARTGGHTRHHQMIWIESGGKRAAYPADLMPTSAHAGAAWIMGIDLYPVDTLTAKRAFLSEAARGEVLVLLDHDPDIVAAHIVEEGGKFHVAAL